MAKDYSGKDDIYFRDSTSLDSKINRIIEKNFFLEIQRMLNYGDFFEIDSEEEVERNGLNQSTIVASLARNLESEIEDNLTLMDKESGFIYLSRLYDRINRALENIKKQVDNIDNDNYEDFLALNEENIEERKFIFKIATFLNETKLYKLNNLKLIIENNLKYYKTKGNEDLSKLKWVGKPSQLGFIISSLVDLGYIEAPIRTNGETNYTQLAKLVKETFNLNTTEATLSKYLNQDSEKGQETVRRFNENSFNIPHVKTIS